MKRIKTYIKKTKTYLKGLCSILLLFSCVEDQDFNQFAPDGSIVVTDVQVAIQEVRDEAGSGGRWCGATTPRWRRDRRCAVGS